MRENGIPKLLTWRWAPCAALVLGSLSFIGFVTLSVPDHIGDTARRASALGLGNHLSRIQSTNGANALSTDINAADADGDEAPSGAFSQPTRVATHGNDVFPKRGFTPPLDRPAPAEPPPPPPPPPVVAAPPMAEAVAPAPPPPEPVAVQPDLPTQRDPATGSAISPNQ